MLGLSPTARTPQAFPPRPGCPLAPEGGSPSRLTEEPLQLPSLFQVPSCHLAFSPGSGSLEYQAGLSVAINGKV